MEVKEGLCMERRPGIRSDAFLQEIKLAVSFAPLVSDAEVQKMQVFHILQVENTLF